MDFAVVVPVLAERCSIDRGQGLMRYFRHWIGWKGRRFQRFLHSSCSEHSFMLGVDLGANPGVDYSYMAIAYLGKQINLFFSVCFKKRLISKHSASLLQVLPPSTTIHKTVTLTMSSRGAFYADKVSVWHPISCSLFQSWCRFLAPRIYTKLSPLPYSSYVLLV